MRHGLPVIGFVGPSSTGKTTLLEGLVRALEERDLAVGVVKHSCHDVSADQPGKDSARLYAAGAEAVALAGQNQIATFVRRETPPRLGDALMSLPVGLDVVLVEGFAWEQIPRYLVLPEGFTETARYSERGPILGTIVPKGEPFFPPEVIAELAGEIAELIGRPPLSDSAEFQ